MTSNDNAVKEFVRIPGKGFLFFARSVKDTKKHEVHLWDGPLCIKTGRTVQLRAKAYTKARKYHITIHEYDTWKQVGEFTMPFLNGQPYVDGTIEIDQRKYKLRMIATDANRIKLSLPQVMSYAEAQRAMV